MNDQIAGVKRQSVSRITSSLVFLACVSAKAQVYVPNATFALDLYPGYTSSAPGTLTGPSYWGGPTHIQSATISQGLDPYVAASLVCTTPTSGTIYSAYATFDYFFTVTNATLSGTASVNVVAFGEATTTDTGYTADASFTVSHETSPGTYVTLLSGSAEHAPSNPTNVISFTINQSLSVPVNTLERVEINAGVDDYGGGNGDTTTTAYVDPQISLGPGQPGDTLVFSPNFLPVPEPSTTGLLVLSLSALAAFRRKSI